ncbi:anti-repressor SinI family protein [Thalassorhabdus alkalitolerans]|uniref:Anti-repressor SinI family protein n=1 Tax=Thalassorhabdus alkalitolerans TaxID=2282697 RepID=A0ABW0YM57_9BACI
MGKQRTSNIDHEWLELIKEAYEIGITKKEVKEFLQREAIKVPL